jgi:hypothetical protein
MTSHGHVRELRRALAARFTLKAFHIVAQGKAMRVKRAWPPPWVIVNPKVSTRPCLSVCLSLALPHNV